LRAHEDCGLGSAVQTVRDTEGGVGLRSLAPSIPTTGTTVVGFGRPLHLHRHMVQFRWTCASLPYNDGRWMFVTTQDPDNYFQTQIPHLPNIPAQRSTVNLMPVMETSSSEAGRAFTGLSFNPILYRVYPFGPISSSLACSLADHRPHVYALRLLISSFHSPGVRTTYPLRHSHRGRPL
jgi:hypothetical protein